MFEYRVKWRREGGSVTTRIYQTRKAAHRKMRGLLALEEVKQDTKMRDMSHLAENPVIEIREVGEWRLSLEQPKSTEADREGMREYFGLDDEMGYF